LRCDSELGYEPTTGHLGVVGPLDEKRPAAGLKFAGDHPDPAVGASGYHHCGNRTVAACNWLVAFEDPGGLCVSCRLTTVRPNDGEASALTEFADAEMAKRRLIHQLNALGLDLVGKADDPERGVAFEFRSSSAEPVMTGHDGGVITLDLSESDDAHREQVRQDLGEPYRTVLGHLRHEIGHYYWPRIIVDAGNTESFRQLFGDETISYQEALDGHYGAGDGPTDAPAGTASASWVDTHVSEYATMHPWEDWAETFAHYLHIRAGLETANTFGFVLGDPALTASREALADDTGASVGPMVQAWLGTTMVINAMSRSLGTGNQYPFVLSPTVIAKLDFVHRMVTAASAPVNEDPPTEVPAADDS